MECSQLIMVAYMTRQMVRLGGQLREEQGASATEYYLLIDLIVLIALDSIQLLGIQVERGFDAFIETFAAAASN